MHRPTHALLCVCTHIHAHKIDCMGCTCGQIDSILAVVEWGGDYGYIPSNLSLSLSLSLHKSQVCDLNTSF